MWAVFRFMMYSYVLWSGVRTMFAVWRLPESWTGPNFWVARAARGASASRIAPRTASLARCSDIPTSLVVGCRWFLGRRLGSAITGDLQCRRWGAPAGSTARSEGG